MVISGSNHKLILEAEKEIATILKNLEVATDAVIQKIEVRDLEVTNVHSTRQEIMRHVHIEMKTMPGTRWE